MKDLVPLLDKLGLTGMKTHLPEIMNLTDSQASDNIYMILKKLLEVLRTTQKIKTAYNG